MNPPDVWRQDIIQNPPSGIVEYALIYILLISLSLSEFILRSVVGTIGDLSPFYISPRLFGTLVYTMLGMTVLGLGYLVYHRTREKEGRLNLYERTRLGLAIFLLLLGGLYSVLGNVNLPVSGTPLLGTFLTSVVGTGLLAVVYLRARDFDIQLRFPGQSAVPMVVTAALMPIFVVAALLFINHWGPVSSSEWILGGQYVSPVSLAHLVQNILFASTFAAFGAALLFQGAIQETLREHATPTGAVAGITVLVGFHRWVTEQMVTMDGVASFFSIVAATTLVVLVTFVVVHLWQILDLTAIDYLTEVTTAAVFGVAVVALLVGGWNSIPNYPNAPFVGYTIGHTVTIGVAAATYERTRSVWVPMLAILTFYIAVDIAPYLQFLIGGVPS